MKPVVFPKSNLQVPNWTWFNTLSLTADNVVDIYV